MDNPAVQLPDYLRDTGKWGAEQRAALIRSHQRRGNVPYGVTNDQLVRGQTAKTKYPEQGLAGYYNDSWGPLLERLQSARTLQGGGVPGALTQVLRRFEGTPGALEDYLNTAAPFLASSIGGTEAFAGSQLRPDNAMAQYGGLVGNTELQKGQAIRAGTKQLNSLGMGRSGGRTALTTNAVQGAAQRNAGLRAGLYGQSQAQERQAAASAFDAHRMVGSMALGYLPRVTQEKQHEIAQNARRRGQAYQAAGTLVGTAIGGFTGAAVTAGTNQAASQ